MQIDRLPAAQPMRSVVLASYQGERFIGEQLDSILAQLGPDDEIVVSDDASKDETLSVIGQRHDPRVKVLANDTRVGYIRNFQRALDHCQGQYVYFSDQDDVWLPGKVEVMDAALRASQCVASDAIVVDELLEPLQRSWFEFRRTRDFSTHSILWRPPIIGATLVCHMRYLKTLLPLPNGIPHDFWLTFNAAWDRVLGIVESPLILYRRHSSVASLTATGSKRRAIAIARERSRLLGAFCWRRFLMPHSRGPKPMGVA